MGLPAVVSPNEALGITGGGLGVRVKYRCDQRPIFKLVHEPTFTCVRKRSHSSARPNAAKGRAARAMNPYRLISRTRDPTVDRLVLEAGAAAATAEAGAFHLLSFKPVPHSCTIVYERMEMHKHLKHLEDISLFRKNYGMERPTLNKLERVDAPFLERNEEFGGTSSSCFKCSTVLSSTSVCMS